jgi:hypothetical protein
LISAIQSNLVKSGKPIMGSIADHKRAMIDTHHEMFQVKQGGTGKLPDACLLLSGKSVTAEHDSGTQIRDVSFSLQTATNITKKLTCVNCNFCSEITFTAPYFVIPNQSVHSEEDGTLLYKRKFGKSCQNCKKNGCVEEVYSFAPCVGMTIVFLDANNSNQTLVPTSEKISLGGKIFALDFLVQYDKNTHYTSSWNIGGDNFVANGINNLQYWKKQEKEQSNCCYKLSVYVLSMGDDVKDQISKSNDLPKRSDDSRSKANIFYAFLKEIGQKSHTDVDFAKLISAGSDITSQRRAKSICVSDRCDTPFNMCEQLAWNASNKKIRKYLVLGDGNCILRTIALALCGDENQWALIRCRAAYHLKLHFGEYSMLIGESLASEAWANLTACDRHVGNPEILIIACLLQRTIIAVVPDNLQDDFAQNVSAEVIEERIARCQATYLPLIPSNGIIATKIEMEPIVIEWTPSFNHVTLLCPEFVQNQSSWLSNVKLPITYPPLVETCVKVGYDFMNISDLSPPSQKACFEPWLQVAEELLSLNSASNMTRKTLPLYIPATIKADKPDNQMIEWINQYELHLLGTDLFLGD